MSDTVDLVISLDGGDTVTVTTTRVDRLRLERCTGLPWRRVALVGFEGTVYKLAWLALQREQSSLVLPWVDLARVTDQELNEGAEALAEVASVAD